MNLSEKFLLAADKKLSNKGKNKNLLDTTSRLIEAGLETGATSLLGEPHVGDLLGAVRGPLQVVRHLLRGQMLLLRRSGHLV